MITNKDSIKLYRDMIVITETVIRLHDYDLNKHIKNENGG